MSTPISGSLEVRMAWTTVGIGKYKDKTLPQILFTDPDWFFSAYEERSFQGLMQEEADTIYRRATSIRVPQQGAERLVADYHMHHPTGKFDHLEIVPVSQPKHKRTVRKDVIDLKVSHDLSYRDKHGGRLLVADTKYLLFGDAKFKMTKAKCEGFFDDKEKFIRS